MDCVSWTHHSVWFVTFSTYLDNDSKFSVVFTESSSPALRSGHPSDSSEKEAGFS